MSWVILTLLLVAVYVLQTAVVGFFELQWLDLFLLLALLFGLTAPLHDARLAAWVVGCVQDLGSADPLGVHAFGLGLTGLLITRLRGVVNLNVWWVRLLVAFPAAWAGVLFYRLHLRLWQHAAGDSWWAMLGSSAWMAFVAALSAAVITSVPRLAGRRRGRGRLRGALR